MEERFDLSWGNKEVRMWCYIMIPLTLISILLIISTDGSFPFVVHAIPTIGWILYGIWRYFFKRNQKSVKNDRY